MGGQIKIVFWSIEEAAIRLVALFNKLDSHQMYTDPLAESSGYTREQIGLLTDEFNAMKTTIGKLIDGTRSTLRDVSDRFSAADTVAATIYDAFKPGTIWAQGEAKTGDSVAGSSGSVSWSNTPEKQPGIPEYDESIVDTVDLHDENNTTKKNKPSEYKPIRNTNTKYKVDVSGH